MESEKGMLSRPSHVHCSLVYPPPYLSCEEGGFSYKLPEATETVVGKEGGRKIKAEKEG